MVSPAGAARDAPAVRSGPTAIARTHAATKIGDTRKATTIAATAIAAIVNETEAEGATATAGDEKTQGPSAASAAVVSAERALEGGVLADRVSGRQVSAGRAWDEAVLAGPVSREAASGALVLARLNWVRAAGNLAGRLGAAILRAAARRGDMSASAAARAARGMLSPRIAADGRAISAIIPAHATGARGRMPHVLIIAGRTIRGAHITPAGGTAIAAELLGVGLFFTAVSMADILGIAVIMDRTAALGIIGTAADGATVTRCAERTGAGDRKAISAADRTASMAADRTNSPAFMADRPRRSIVPLAALNRAAGEMAAKNVVATSRRDDQGRAPTFGAAS